MPIENLHCSLCGAADPASCACATEHGQPLEAYTLTSTGEHPCPSCGSLAYVHPQGTDWDDGWCPDCHKWLTPKGTD